MMNVEASLALIHSVVTQNQDSNMFLINGSSCVDTSKQQRNSSVTNVVTDEIAVSNSKSQVHFSFLFRKIDVFYWIWPDFEFPVVPCTLNQAPKPMQGLK